MSEKRADQIIPEYLESEMKWMDKHGRLTEEILEQLKMLNKNIEALAAQLAYAPPAAGGTEFQKTKESWNEKVEEQSVAKKRKN